MPLIGMVMENAISGVPNQMFSPQLRIISKRPDGIDQLTWGRRVLLPDKFVMDGKDATTLADKK